MTITLHNPVATSKRDVCLLPIPADSGQGRNVGPSNTNPLMDGADAVPLEVMADRYRPASNLVIPSGKGRRPPQWDDPRILTLLGYLELGAYRGQAITAAGLAERTVMRWLEVGRDEAKRSECEDLPLTFYVHFWQSVRRAEGVPVMRALNVIRRAGARGSWRASAWFLERRYPDRWGRKATAWEREQEWSRSTKDVSCPVSVEDLEAKVLRILERQELQ